MGLDDARKAVEEYNSDAAQLGRAKMELETVEQTYEAAKNAVVLARATMDVIADQTFSNPAYVVAFKNLLEAQTAQLTAFNELVSVREKVDGLTPETEKLKVARDALAEQVRTLQARLEAEQKKNRDLDAQLNPDPVVSSPFAGFGIVSAANTAAAGKVMRAAAAAAVTGLDVADTVAVVAATEDAPLTLGSKIIRQQAVDTDVTTTHLFGLTVAEDDGRLDYVVSLGTGDDANTEDVSIAFGTGGTSIQMNQNDDLIDDAEVWVAARTTFEKGSTDYMTYGAWLVLPEDAGSTATPDFGAFVDVRFNTKYAPFVGVEALTGTATFTGTATGLYGNTATKETGVFDADARLTASFGAATESTISGLLTNPRVDGAAMGDAFVLREAAVGDDTGAFNGTTTMVIGNDVLSGNWGGQLFGQDTGLGQGPTMALGTFGAADETQAVVGTFMTDR